MKASVYFSIMLVISSGHAYSEQVNLGSGSTVLGDDAAAFGRFTEAIGNYATAMGFNSTSSGDNSFSVGHTNYAMGPNSAAFGSRSTANGKNAFAVGSENQAKAENSAAFGLGTKAKYKNSFIIGKYNFAVDDAEPNVDNPTDELFVIGNGYLTDEITGYPQVFGSNALTVHRNGNTKLTGNLHVSRLLTFDSQRKNSIEPMKNSLERVRQLQGYSYILTKDENQAIKFGLLDFEVSESLPEITYQTQFGRGSIEYSKISALFVESIKELDEENILLKNNVDELSRKTNELEQQNEQLISALCEIQSTLSICE